MDSLLERFCRYVRVETTSVEDATQYPSSPGQLDLGRMLADELRGLNLDRTEIDQRGIVSALMPGNVPDAPTIAWISHIDTSPEYTAKNVQPIVHANYDGKDIVLPGDSSQVIRVSETEGLARLKGKTLITSDGTTLLGADDKCGIAVIMTAAAHLISHPEIQRGPIRIVFTCDEETGRGTEKLDLEKIGAQVAYTLDGESEATIETETFSGDLALVTIQGKNTHPGFAKQGGMINAVRLAAAFVDRMPWQTLAPETTADRDGFMHPYVVEGGVEKVRIRILLRSFLASELAEQAKTLHNVAAILTTEFPNATIDIRVTEQYRNMLTYLDKDPRAVKLAEEAVRRAGLQPRFQSVRGGTDGSKLSEMGLPTPNLSAGMHNFHTPREFACLEQMDNAVKVLVELAQLWGRETA